MIIPEMIGLVGLPWFREEDYHACVAIMDDAGTFPVDFASWLQDAEQRERRLLGEGKIVVRAVIDSKEFAFWAPALGMKPGGESRYFFAREFAIRWFRDKHKAM